MIRQVAVIGTGTMGRGIAYLAATSGFDTVIYDPDRAALVAAEAADAALVRVHLATDIEPAVRAADLIVEAVPENLQLKSDIFAQTDLFCSEETILASNTSSISISKLAGNVERRDRFIGLHFFNPPHLMKLIEIVRGERTSDETVGAMLDLAK